MNHKDIKLFFRFLKENDCYKEFIDNTNNIEINYFDGINDFLINVSTNEIIKYAFSWYDSPQGYDYWSLINSRWIDIEPLPF